MSLRMLFLLVYVSCYVSSLDKLQILTKKLLIQYLLEYRSRVISNKFDPYAPRTTTPKPSVNYSLHVPLAKIRLPPAKIMTGEKKVLDLPLSAFDIYNEACGEASLSVEWAYKNKTGSVQVINKGWLSDDGLPLDFSGLLMPVCMCVNGRVAMVSKLVRLRSLVSFLPLLEHGFSVLSTILLDSCSSVSSNITTFWPPECTVCNVKNTKSCTASYDENSEKNIVACDCVTGYDEKTLCGRPHDACSLVQRDAGGTEISGNELCQVYAGNKCLPNGDSYLCLCYLPYFEDKEANKMPNCYGKRASADPECEKKFCGTGSCIASQNGTSVCLCRQGFTGDNCMQVAAVLDTNWSGWTNCYPLCANVGLMSRERKCHPPNSDYSFCEGVRQQFKRCSPSSCFGTHPSLSEVSSITSIPRGGLTWSFLIFLKSILLFFLVGLLLVLLQNYQDWKFDSLQSAGVLAKALSDASDSIIVREVLPATQVVHGYHVPTGVAEQFRSEKVNE